MGFDRVFAEQTLYQSLRAKALRSKAFALRLLNFARLNQTDVKKAETYLGERSPPLPVEQL